MALKRKVPWLAAVIVLLPAAMCLLGTAPATEPPAGSDIQGDPLPAGALARLGTTRWRYQYGMGTASFSPDGRFVVSSIATSTPPSSLLIWDSRTGRLLHQLGEKTAEEGMGFDHYAFLPDGSAILSVYSQLQRLILWSVATGREIRRWPAPPEVTGLAISGCGIAAIADSNGAVWLWDVTRDQAPKPVPWKDAVPLGYSVALSPDGKRLVTLGDWNRVRVLELPTGKVLQHFRPGKRGPATLAPDGRAVLTLSAGEGLQLWDVASGKPRHLENARQDDDTRIGFSSDGKVALAVGADTIRLWDVATGRQLPIKPYSGWNANPGPLVALGPEGKVAATRSASGCNMLRLWDTQTGQLLQDYAAHAAAPEQLFFSADGRRLTSFAPDEHEWIYWDVPRGRLLRMRHPRETFHLSEHDPLVRISPDGRWVALADWENMQLYDAQSHKVVREIKWAGERTTALAFSPEGDRVAVATAGGIIRIYEVSSRRYRTIVTNTHGQAISWVQFTPDGRTLASGNGPSRFIDGVQKVSVENPLRVQLWDAATLRHLGALTADPDRWRDTAFCGNWECAFSPDGKKLFVSNCGHLMVWDLARRRDVDSFEPDPDARSQEGVSGPVAVSPDGRVLAWLGANAPLTLWEVASGRKVYQFEQLFSSIAFAPVGLTLATGCQTDSSILLWHLPTLWRLRATGTTSQTSFWQDLANADAERAYQSMGCLLSDPHAIELLAAHLVPAPLPDIPRMGRLLRDLDSDDYATRARALLALEKMGDAIHQDLEDVCKRSPSAEVRHRLRQLLGKLDQKSPERLREVRAVQVLEYLGTPPVRELLRKLAGGAPQARLTQEAKASLERLDRKPPAP